MTLSRYQLQRTDLITTIEQGRRVETELFAENHRGLGTMAELLKARLFGATEWAVSLRKRMLAYATCKDSANDPLRGSSEPESHVDPHPDHGVMCECDGCTEAVKRILRDLGVLPRGATEFKDLTAEPITGRLKVPTRYRKDESDK